jgi:hypothetical protein
MLCYKTFHTMVTLGAHTTLGYHLPAWHTPYPYAPKYLLPSIMKLGSNTN